MAERTFYLKKNFASNSNHKMFNPDSSADEEKSLEAENSSMYEDNDYKGIQNDKNQKSFVKRVEEKIDRVRRLSEKLSKIQFQDKENPNNLNKLETKFEVIEDNFHHAYETMKTKYNTLREHSAQMKQRLEEESDVKEDLKRNVANRLNLLQTKVKSMIIEEKEHFKFYTDNLSAKLEAELIRVQTELKKDDDALLKNVNEIKENIKIDLPEIGNRINLERDEREKSMDLLFQDLILEFNKLKAAIEEISLKRNHNNKDAQVAVRNMVDSVSEAIYTENEKMGRFKENINKLLEETSNQISIN